MNEKIEQKDMHAKILDIIKANGPSLPSLIARETGQSQLFAGAFLSELSNKGQLKMSKMKVGSSPLYLIPGQEPMLEGFIEYLGGKEREAFHLLKKKGILQDELQTPAIRVALRSIRDFALPFKKQDKIFWRYFLLKEMPKSVEKKPEPEKPVQIQQPKPEPIENKPEPIQPPPKQEVIEKQAPLIITEKPKITKRKIPAKEKFLEEVKDFLEENNIEFLQIEKYDKKQVFARIKSEDVEYLLAAFNKKRFDESDLIKLYRKYNELDLDFYLISRGEIAKKTEDTIKACKKLRKIAKLE